MQKGRPARESRDARPATKGRSARTGRSTAPKPGRGKAASAKDAGSRASSRSAGGAARSGARTGAAAASPSEAAELVRLNKYLASHGVASRRGCDELIVEGQVMVDGEIVTDLGVKVDPSRQRVEVDGVVLKPEGVRHRYYLLNKPSGVVCTNSERELRPRAVDLISDRDKGRVFTVGRLDEDTTGLILITNDGDFANRVMHPRYGVDKTYLVKVQGRIDDEALQRIRDGVHLAEGRTGGARVVVQRRTAMASKLLVTIQEGKNREVRRIFARTGFKVLDLKRIRIGNLTDRGLKTGKWRPLRRAEIDELLAGPTQASREESPRGRGRGRRGSSGTAGQPAGAPTQGRAMGVGTKRAATGTATGAARGARTAGGPVRARDDGGAQHPLARGGRGRHGDGESRTGDRSGRDRGERGGGRGAGARTGRTARAASQGARRGERRDPDGGSGRGRRVVS